MSILTTEIPALTLSAQSSVASPSLLAAMFLVYDDPKSGKTSLALRAFPDAIMVGVPSAIQLVAQNVCGFTPDWIVGNVTTLPELVGFLLWMKSKEGQEAVKQRRKTKLYVDDLSQVCSKSILVWATEKSNDKYYKFNMLDQHLDWVSILMRELGMLCALSAHKSMPVWDKNEPPALIAPGAPEVPSRNQLQAVPGWVDFVAPLKAHVKSLDPWWPRVMAVESSATKQWISGDRNNVCWEETPANLREVLRVTGAYDLPRLPGMEWMDDTAEVVCSALLTGEPVLSVLERIFTHYATYAIPGTPGERHVQWACQDGIARFVIRQHTSQGVMGPIRARAAAAQASAPPPPKP